MMTPRVMIKVAFALLALAAGIMALEPLKPWLPMCGNPWHIGFCVTR